MSPRLLRPKASGDPDAQRYIAAVQATDQQSLEPAVRKAISNFVIGCKQDGTWNAMKASCILAGARTLAGALVPLKGPAPTNNGPFVTGDYNRETGLAGNGSNKFLDTGRASNAQGQNDIHICLYASTLNTGIQYYFGDSIVGASLTHIFSQSGELNFKNRDNTGSGIVYSRHAIGFLGMNRAASSAYVVRGNAGETTITVASVTPPADSFVFYRGSSSSGFVASGRYAFYSVGESLSLANLDARVSALITEIGAAI